MSKIKLCSKDEENLIEELQHLSEVLEEIGVEGVAVVSGYLLMAIMTVGYAAIWINGSIFYTWSFPFLP